MGKLLSTTEVANFLQCSPQLVTKLARNGELRAFKFGYLWRFKLEDIKEYLKSNENSVKKQEAVESS